MLAIYKRAIARAWYAYRELSSLLLADAREILHDIWHVGPMSHPKRSRKMERQPKSAPSKSPVMSCRLLHSPRWCTQFPASCSTGCGECAPLPTRPAKRALSSAKWWRASRILTAIFRSLRQSSRSRSFPNGAASQIARRKTAKPSPKNSTRDSAAALPGWWTTPRTPPRVLADAYRAVVGLTEAECPDAEALDRMLNPARNPYRLETMNVGVHAPMMRPLQHANFTFAKKISHTADSQDQRHRMVPGSRPLLTLTDTREPDYITPMLHPRKSARPRSL